VCVDMRISTLCQLEILISKI